MKHKNIGIMLGMLFLFPACSRFTEVDLPQDQITRDMVFKDEALAHATMAGIYRSLEESGFLSGSSGGAQSYLSCYTDELLSYAPAGNDTSQFYTLTHNALTQTVGNLWSVTYKQVYYINSVIEGLEHSPNISASVKARLSGEAYFLRAILHLYLTGTYGGVPYIKVTDYETNSHVSRESQAAVYAKVREDLLQSVEGLPDALPKGSRVTPTKMAAYALLSRLAYYQKDWNAALEYSGLVLSRSDYAPETDLDKVFLKHSSSAIWQLMPYDSTYPANEGNFFILQTAPPARVALSPAFVNGFESGDKRRTQWVGEVQDPQNTTYYYPFKYKQSSITSSSSEYSVILRVEELYLIRSEAYTRRNELNMGLSDLNKIRGRAGLPVLSNLGQDQLLVAIVRERKYELFTEFGHRLYDLSHFGILDQTMLAQKFSWKSSYKFLPLPEQELLRNPKLKPQNDGY